MTIIVATTDQLLAMRDSSGAITVDDDLRIECDAPYSVGSQISGFHVRGDLYASGNLYLWGNQHVGGYLDVRGEYFIVEKDLFWAQAHKPRMPEKNWIGGRVLPPKHQREHWQERIGLNISDGCYDAICKKVVTHLDRLLNDTKWSSTERWMLTSLRKTPKPDWVNDERCGMSTPHTPGPWELSYDKGSTLDIMTKDARICTIAKATGCSA